MEVLRRTDVINHFHRPTATGDTLDFFIDDMTHPAFSIKYMDLFSGKVFPFSKPLCGVSWVEIIVTFLSPIKKESLQLYPKNPNYFLYQNKPFILVGSG